MADDFEENIDTVRDAPQSGVGASYTKHNEIKSGRLEVISTADDKLNISEPSSPTHSQYPWNKSEQTLSGHLIEVDDTPGAERILEMHKSGTFYEVHPDGGRVTKIFGDDFYITLEDHNLVVGGNINITVQGDANLLVKGNMKQKVGGNYDLTVHGDMTTRVEGKRLDYTKDTHNIQTSNDLSLRARNNIISYSGKATNIQASTSIICKSYGSMNLFANGSLKVKSGDDMQLNTNSRMYLDASRIDAALPGPSVSLSDISSNDPKDKDPTGGLSIEDSVMEPSISNLFILRSGNLELNSLISESITYPKDRTII